MSTKRISQILPDLCKGLDLDQKVREMAVLALWPTLVEDLLMGYPALLQNTKPLKLKKRAGKTVLYIKVKHAVLATELSFHSLSLLDAFNRFSPQTGIQVDQIQWQVGAIVSL